MGQTYEHHPDEKMLMEWTNAEETGYPRFRPSRYRCPRCNRLALEDNWPPNYGGSKGCFRDGALHFESGGTVKCVCVHCRVWFEVHWANIDGVETALPSVARELVLHNGKLLTPHDVWRQKYFDEHGEWPREAYA